MVLTIALAYDKFIIGSDFLMAIAKNYLTADEVRALLRKPKELTRANLMDIANYSMHTYATKWLGFDFDKINVRFEDLGIKEGDANDKEIRIKNNALTYVLECAHKDENYMSRLAEFLAKCNHEVKHVSQWRGAKEITFDYNAIHYSKERMAMGFLYNEDVNKDFYGRNYVNLGIEADAQWSGSIFAIANLNSLMPERKGEIWQKIAYGGAINRFLELSLGNKSHDSVTKLPIHFDMLDRNFNEDGDFSRDKIHIEGQSNIAINAISDYLVFNNPEGFLKKYPILNLEYNENGVKKTYEEILETKKDILKELVETGQNDDKVEITVGISNTKSQAIEKIFDNIIESDPLLKIQKLGAELTTLELNQSRGTRKEELLNEIKELAKNNEFYSTNIVKWFESQEKELSNVISKINEIPLAERDEYLKILQNKYSAFGEVKKTLLENNSRLQQHYKDLEILDKKIRESADIVKKTWNIDIIHTNTSVRSLLHNNELLQSREDLSEKLSTAVFRVPMEDMGTKREAIEAVNFLQKCLKNKEIYEQTMGAFRLERTLEKKPITNVIPFSKGR